jgi:hypothetical protein
MCSVSNGAGAPHTVGGMGWHGPPAGRLNGGVESLLEDVMVAPVEAFLDAVDKVMNSNTLLLKARADVPVTPANRAEVLQSLLRSSVFARMIREADHQRGWYNMQDGSPVLDSFDLQLQELSESAFVARLRWMLMEAFSPYRRHLSAPRADEVIDGFLLWLNTQQPHGEHGREPWSFCDVHPNFLRSTGYYVNAPGTAQTTYFDGGPSDTATLIHGRTLILLLLTNGSP